uniref:Uncharacterized protein n=1 Tax=Arion vulgaris TaxID=1028688 RepID=A0A0B7A1S3_9EUPU
MGGSMVKQLRSLPVILKVVDSNPDRVVCNFFHGIPRIVGATEIVLYATLLLDRVSFLLIGTEPYGEPGTMKSIFGSF